MAYTGTPATMAVGHVVTAAEWNAEIRDPLAALSGAWDTYTPTLAQGASSNIAKTVNMAAYIHFGKLVILNFSLTATAAGTAGSQVTITLPVTAALTGLYVGAGSYNDASSSAFYPAIISLASTTTLRMVRSDTQPTSGVGADPNIAVASTDVLSGFAIYQAA